MPIFKQDMDHSQIEQKLGTRLCFDEMRDLAMLILNRHSCITEILILCDHQNKQIAFRASWTLEFIAYNDSKRFLKHLNDFIKLYPIITNQSVQRSFSKILMMLTRESIIKTENIDPHIFDECMSTTFDWLLNPKTALAIQCNALDVLFNLSHYHHWILDELKVILQDKLISNSPALISRSTRLLKVINRF